MQVLGQGKDVTRFKKFFAKSLLFLFYFQVLPLSSFSSLSQLNVHFPYSIPSHSILFSYFSNSPVLHCFCNESSLHIRGAPTIRIDSSPSRGFLITRHMQNLILHISTSLPDPPILSRLHATREHNTPLIRPHSSHEGTRYFRHLSTPSAWAFVLVSDQPKQAYRSM